LLLENFQDTRKWDDGSRIELSQIDKLLQMKFVDMPISIQAYGVLAYDCTKRIFTYERIQEIMSPRSKYKKRN